MSTKSVTILAAALLTGCVTTNSHVPAPQPGPAQAPPRAPAVVRASAGDPVPAPAPIILSRVYFYPERGQSEVQQDRDRYECYNWSVRQTGFDPGRRALPPEQRAAMVPARASGASAVAGAVVGAVIGASIAHDGHEAGGAIVGAVAGGVLGSAAEAADAQRISRETRPQGRGATRYEQEAAEYRRAMSACLEGRGYSVK
jgi:hypothetical protein